MGKVETIQFISSLLETSIDHFWTNDLIDMGLSFDNFPLTGNNTGCPKKMSEVGLRHI